MRGANLRARVHISFEEAVTGVKKEIEITLKDECKQCHGTGAKPGTSPETCSRCGGSGQEVFTQQSLFGAMRSVRPCSGCGGSGKIIRDKCPDCQGTGYVRNRQRISIDIPAGIDDGQSIRLRGKGDPGVNGGERGDLLVEVSVAQHPLFKRQDTDIFSTVPISFAQAALGGPIRIRTVDGEVEFQVKPGTQTDTRIRLRGKGMPSLNSRGTRGDHYVTLVVQVPTRLTSEQADALRAFDEAMNGGSRNDGSEKGRKKKIFG
jgi:molecular chaperone DnaJ